MKRYNFCLFFALLWSNVIIFGGHDSSLNEYTVKIIDRNDIAKYWLIKQLCGKNNKNNSDKINFFLIALKKPTIMLQKEFFKTKTIGCRLSENDCIYYHFRLGNSSHEREKILPFYPLFHPRENDEIFPCLIEMRRQASFVYLSKEFSKLSIDLDDFD